MTPDPSALMPLEKAVELPQLGGLFSRRDLRRYASRPKNPLPCIRPGREYLTTAQWVDEWLQELKTCRDPACLLTPRTGQTAPTSASQTAAPASASSPVTSQGSVDEAAAYLAVARYVVAQADAAARTAAPTTDLDVKKSEVPQDPQEHDMATHRTAVYAGIPFTTPSQAHLSEAELIDAAVEEARHANVLGSGENRVTEEELRREIMIEEWDD